MAKKEFNIQQIINLLRTVETLISSTTYDIIANNASLKTSSGEKINTEDLFSKLLDLYDQLNVLKQAKEKANRSKTTLGSTNQQLIFELSNLNRKKSMLETLFEQKTKVRKGGKDNQFDFFIPKTDIQDRLDITNERITDIKEAMTKFNNSHTVKLVLNDDLNLV